MKQFDGVPDDVIKEGTGMFEDNNDRVWTKPN